MLQSKWFDSLPMIVQLPLALVYGCLYAIFGGSLLAWALAAPFIPWLLAGVAAWALLGGFFNLF